MRVLVADSFAPWRRFVSSLMQKESEWQVVAEASDGLEAIKKTLELKPDLVLLELSLPKLSGIQTAELIREFAPKCKVIFASTHDELDYAQEALSIGARGYVLKVSSARDLGRAVKAVFQGKRFVSSNIKGIIPVNADDINALKGLVGHEGLAPRQALRRRSAMGCRHAIQVCSDDDCLLDRFTQFVEVALKEENSAIVAATKSHRDGIFSRLRSRGLNISAAIDQGRYVAVDAAETIESYTVNGKLDRYRFREVAESCIAHIAKTAKGAPPRVAACGECAPLLLARGMPEEAVQLEQLWNELAEILEVEVLCSYPWKHFDQQKDRNIFLKVCAEHSACSFR
jgi:DNA-binding NarL/FixJ family response regulator